MKTINYRIEDLIVKLNPNYFNNSVLVNEVEQECVTKKDIFIPKYLNCLFRILENYNNLIPMWKDTFDTALSIVEKILTNIYNFVEDEIFVQELEKKVYIKFLVNLFYDLCTTIKIISIVKLEEIIEN